MIGQHQNDHFDMVLQSMQQDHDAWFRNQLLQMLKVGIKLTWSKMTISYLGYFYIFLCIFFSIVLFVSGPKIIVFGFKVIHTIQTHIHSKLNAHEN